MIGAGLRVTFAAAPQASARSTSPSRSAARPHCRPVVVSAPAWSTGRTASRATAVIRRGDSPGAGSRCGNRLTVVTTASGAGSGRSTSSRTCVAGRDTGRARFAFSSTCTAGCAAAASGRRPRGVAGAGFRRVNLTGVITAAALGVAAGVRGTAGAGIDADSTAPTEIGSAGAVEASVGACGCAVDSLATDRGSAELGAGPATGGGSAVTGEGAGGSPGPGTATTGRAGSRPSGST
jgi:hypothetical protein